MNDLTLYLLTIRGTLSPGTLEEARNIPCRACQGPVQSISLPVVGREHAPALAAFAVSVQWLSAG